MTTCDGSTPSRAAASVIAATTAGRVRRSSGSAALPPEGEGDAVPLGATLAVGVPVTEVAGELEAPAPGPSSDMAQALSPTRATASTTASRTEGFIGSP